MPVYNGYTDSELVALLKKGDEAAYAEIYNRYVVSLTGFAESKLYSLEDARDLIHDLFTDLWSRRHTICVTGNLKAYLFATARHQIINKIRKNMVREEYANRLRTLSPAYHSLEEELDARELRRSLLTKLGELPEKAKHIYQQSRNENKTNREIATMLHLSEQTVKNQISTVLKHLRRSLSNFFSLL